MSLVHYALGHVRLPLAALAQLHDWLAPDVAAGAGTQQARAEALLAMLFHGQEAALTAARNVQLHAAAAAAPRWVDDLTCAVWDCLAEDPDAKREFPTVASAVATACGT